MFLTRHPRWRKILFVILILVLFVVFDRLATYTVYSPAIATELYRFADNLGFGKFYAATKSVTNGEGTGELYPLTTVSSINNSLFWSPRAAVRGTISDIIKAWDGDWHVNIKDAKGNVLVMEIIPEYPLPIPKIGEKIQAWGITRYDLEHRWWELHPLIGWKQI